MATSGRRWHRFPERWICKRLYPNQGMNKPAARRVCVALDPEMLIEALILRHLVTLPKRRHADWIRALLVQGYLAEQRLVRAMDIDPSAPGSRNRAITRSTPSGFAFMPGVSRPTPVQPIARADQPNRPTVPNASLAPNRSDKPYAHLRKVVG